MYERNAIVLERFFDDLFGNNEQCNLKNNFLKYDNLVNCSAKYTEATNSEDKIMQEYDDIAGRIKNIQKNQEFLSENSVKFQEEINIIFQNIAEEPEKMRKMFEELDKKVDQNINEMRKNEQDFVRVISSFTEKSDVRNTLGKERKQVESDYSKALNETLESHRNVNKEKLQLARNFCENVAEIEKSLTENINKNGENEIVPFNDEAIKAAIKLEINIQKKVVEIYCNAYDKTSRLFLEIKNNNTRLERHRKVITDSKVKLEFLKALKQYLVQFLDNERLTAVNGETEHNKQMKEACKNFENDLAQINNLYELLLKEISSKANKKMYKELYNIEYLEELEKSVVQFEREVSKLNLLGTVINPNHWRIDGIKKIYDVFYKSVTEIYGRDLSEFIVKEEKQIPESNNNEEENEEANTNQEIILNKPVEEKKDDKFEKSLKDIDNYVKEIEKNAKKKLSNKDDEEDEFDEKIDMILGFDKGTIIPNENEERVNDEDDGLSEYDSTISDDDFWADDDDDSYDWESSKDEEDENLDYLDEDREPQDDYQLDDENNDFQDDYQLDDEKIDYNQNDEYYQDDDDQNYEYFQNDDFEFQEDNTWTNDDIIISNGSKNKKDKKEDSNLKIIDSKNKKARGKHNKKDDKPRGLLGKLLK